MRRAQASSQSDIWLWAADPLDSCCGSRGKRKYRTINSGIYKKKDKSWEIREHKANSDTTLLNLSIRTGYFYVK
jgi:hypothetical protein